MSYSPPTTDASTGILSHLSQAYLERLCAHEILEQGFDSADASALSELVAQAVQFLACLCFEAKSAAQHGRRAQVATLDVLDVAHAAGMSASDLRQLHERQSTRPLGPSSLSFSHLYCSKRHAYNKDADRCQYGI